MHRFHQHRWARGPHNHEDGRGRGFDRHGFGGGRHGGRGGWGGRGGGMGRMFEQGALKTIVLSLIAEQPRHGYDVIKEIETRMGGAYAPSPGVIYPLLTMLEEMGLVELQASEGAKKLYGITDAGKAELEANKPEADALFERIDAIRERMSGGRSPQLTRAWENLKLALNLRVERGNLSDEQIQAIAAALDSAAQTIERS